MKIIRLLTVLALINHFAPARCMENDVLNLMMNEDKKAKENNLTVEDVARKIKPKGILDLVDGHNPQQLSDAEEIENKYITKVLNRAYKERMKSQEASSEEEIPNLPLDTEESDN